MAAGGAGSGPGSSTITPHPSPEPGNRLLANLSIGRARRDSGSMSQLPGTNVGAEAAAAAALAVARATGGAGPPGSDPGRWSKFIKAIKFTGKEEGPLAAGAAGSMAPLAAGSLPRSRSTSGSSKVPPALGAAGASSAAGAADFELVSAADAAPFIAAAPK